MYPKPEDNFVAVTPGSAESICRANFTSNEEPFARSRLAVNGVSANRKYIAQDAQFGYCSVEEGNTFGEA